MRDKLRNYVDGLFVDAELTIANAELKNEIMNDTLAHYDDLLANGQSEQNAYTQTIEKIGDVSHLIAKKHNMENVGSTLQNNPYQEYLNINNQNTNASANSRNIYTNNSTTKNEEIKELQKVALAPAIMLAVAIALYIFSIIPCIIFEGSTLGVVLMFIAVGIATALIIIRGAFTYNDSNTKSSKSIDNSASIQNNVNVQNSGNYEKRRHRKGTLKPPFRLIKGILDAVLFIASILIYVGLSLSFGAWHIAWIVFIISVAISEIIEGIFQLVGGAYDED